MPDEPLGHAGDNEPEDYRFDVLRLHAPEGWFAVLVPLAPLPLPIRYRPAYRRALEILVSRLRGSDQRSVILELEHLHKEGAIRDVSRNGARWIPEMGLGVEPGAAPPKLWSFAELSERSVDDPFPPLIRNVMHLEGDERAMQHAVQTMAGTGALLQVVHPVPVETMLEEWKAALLPPIQEEALRAFPLYVPLLSAAALRNVDQATLSVWLGHAHAYLRESTEDRGLLVIARRPLDTPLAGTGFQLPPETNRQSGSGKVLQPASD